MRFGFRAAVLVVAVCLPLGAVLLSYALAGDPASPRVPAPVVRMGESGPPETAGPPATTTTTTPPPDTEAVPHVPPVGDDDTGDDGDDGDDTGTDDDGD